VTEKEVDAIARFLGRTTEDFIESHTRLTANRRGLSLIDRPTGECIFLEGNTCTIQPVKPTQCAGFPNDWRFPGWSEVCEAIPLPVSD